MATRDCICRVRALYAYESTDPSSLSFRPDAIIEVFAQLESGWWDGWCDGKRGWFPSNYVEIIREVPEATDENQLWDAQHQWNQRQQQQSDHHSTREHRPTRENTDKQHLRLSLQDADALYNQPNHSNESEIKTTHWVLQYTEDGSEQYYFNTRTQEMRYSIPPEGFMDEAMKSNVSSSNNLSGLNDDYSHVSTPESFDKPVRPMRAVNRILMDEGYNDRAHSPAVFDSSPHLSEKHSDHFDNENLNENKLPPNWIRKVTPKGRYFYYNIVTNEVTWELENIDPDTGLLANLLPTSPQFGHTESVNSFVNNQTSDEKSSHNWNSLASLITQAIHNLKESIRRGLSNYFSEDTNAVVHRVRLLLYTTNCLDKETSPYLKSNKYLRGQHRTLLAALAKLVLSTKVASTSWTGGEASTKLQGEADDVLIYVQNFIQSAQEIHVELKETKPTLMMDNNLWKNPYTIKSNNGVSMLNQPDISSATAVLADNTKSVLRTFLDNVKNGFGAPSSDEAIDTFPPRLDAPLLVAQFRNLSNTTSIFLNAIEELCHAQQGSLRSMRIMKAKQPLYPAMGSLFVVCQNITHQNADDIEIQNCHQLLTRSAEAIESAVDGVVEATKDNGNELVPDHTMRNTPTPTQKLYEYQNSSSPSHTSQVISREHTPIPAVNDDEEDDRSDEMDREVKRINVSLDALMSHASLGSYKSSDVDKDGEGDHDFASAEEEIKDSEHTQGTENDHESSHSESVVSSNASTATQSKEAKIARFFGEDTIAAARYRDTVSSSPSGNLSMNSSTIASPGINSSGASTLVTSVNPIGSSETPPYLQSDLNPEEVVFNMEGNVKGGTLHSLVQYLTQHDQLDSKFNITFLLTYRSFSTTEELFEELFQRYQLQPPENLFPEEYEIWKEKKLKLVRLRVFNVIKSWLETYFNEEQDKPLLPKIADFTEHVIVESMKFGADQLNKLINKRMMSEDSSQIRKMKLNVRTGEMPVPILPKNMKRIKFLELDPHELARQMTIMDFSLYSRIKPVECLDKNWGLPDTDTIHIAANVKASIEHSNQVTAWVTDSILAKEELKKRAGVMKHWIFVAEKCRLLNNYNTCMAILSAFDNGSIGRLKRSWELISAKTMLILQNIRRLMGANRNFSEYREIIHKVNPPCIPFLGIYLQDLTFIEDGNSNYLKKSNNLINFAKRMKTAEVILDLQQYQSTHYLLNVVPDIQEFIKTHLHSSREEEELYNLSLKLEPRERGEDTIARRLKESGL
ncbi:ras guanine nucleotide exchange factor domain-containing protein [Pilobolus umbonatus]|nr:ras guanine nucleotide exchange factor domain-containing protein [Pilobolus umbonatus]